VKLAASNIGWAAEDDATVYEKMKALGFSGLEIAPTRLVAERPYDKDGRTSAAAITADISSRWGLRVCSMQSIWYGLTERIFGSSEERDFLYRYTCSAIDYAAFVGVPHLVFGCPKNRVIDHPDQYPVGVKFFADCAEYALKKGVVIGIEANPPIYGTNYLNTTLEALALLKAVGSPALGLNLDLGTIIANEESLEALPAVIPYASHVQISEPGLAKIVRRPEQVELARLLDAQQYSGWVSLEMRNLGLPELFSSLDIVAEVFG
jgi:sugar phosphate isomerase/epimerase